MAYLNNPEALAQLQSQAVSLCQRVGVVPVLSDGCNRLEDVEQSLLSQSIYAIKPHLEVAQWVCDRALSLAHLQGLPEAQKEDALWDLAPCPLPLGSLVALLKDVNPDFLDDKNHLVLQTYLTPVLFGVGEKLGELAFYSIKTLLMHYQFMQQMKVEVDDKALWAALWAFIYEFNKNSQTPEPTSETLEGALKETLAEALRDAGVSIKQPSRGKR